MTPVGSGAATTRGFVLLFQGRTGSSYLTQCLDAHPSVRMLPEVFGDMGFKTPIEEREGRAAEQLQWLDRFFSEPVGPGLLARGFKTKMTDVLDVRGFTERLRARKVHVLHMTRRNLVKLAVSELNAARLHRERGVWNLEPGQEALPPFRVDPEAFDEMLRRKERFEGLLADYVRNELALPTLSLAYEDLLRDREAVLDRIWGFLGVPGARTEGSLRKNTSDDLRRVLLNFDDLRARYAGTPYEPMFDEVLVP